MSCLESKICNKNNKKKSVNIPLVITSVFMLEVLFIVISIML